MTNLSTSAGKSQAHVPTRILIISDTHAVAPQPAHQTSVAYREPLPSVDILLHAGDITRVGRIEEFEVIFDALKAADAELKLVIAGNHDITLDESFRNKIGYLSRGIAPEDLEAVKSLWLGDEAKRHGIVYLEEGVRTFELKSGATFTIYTSPYQPEFCGWAFSYERDEDRFNFAPDKSGPAPANPVPSYPRVDLMMTHGPPLGILDTVTYGKPVGCRNLLRAVERARPRLHCFGHIHEGWGAERVEWKKRDLAEHVPDDELESTITRVHRYEPNTVQVMADRAAAVDVSMNSERPLVPGKETLFVNASIMTARYKPTQAPWLIELDLPRSGK